MRRTPWTTYLWPGLPQLWSHGSWSGLAVAIGAAVALDAVVLASFGWTELVGSGVRSALWAAFALAWITAAVWSAIHGGAPVAAASDGRDDPFAGAVELYLKGDYYRAEQMLVGLLRRNLRDLDARIMLATLLRRSGRLDEAGRQLDVLARFEGADKWELEIQQERRLLTSATTHDAAAA
jgi:hypothetical protein